MLAWQIASDYYAEGLQTADKQSGFMRNQAALLEK
jgi:hypothetical protein